LDTVARLSELLRAALADPAVRQGSSLPAAAAADRRPTKLRAFIVDTKWTASGPGIQRNERR
jgi:hypothetical protein